MSIMIVFVLCTATKNGHIDVREYQRETTNNGHIDVREYQRETTNNGHIDVREYQRETTNNGHRYSLTSICPLLVVSLWSLTSICPFLVVPLVFSNVYMFIMIVFVYN
jgi:hypothetical protein